MGRKASSPMITPQRMGDRSPKLYMVYPQGNYITAWSGTTALELG